MTVKDPAALEAFLAEPRNVVVIGRRADGRPHATPNWFLWRDGRFHVSTTKTRLKYRVFSNDPYVQLVLDDPTGFRYVIVEGTVSIVERVDDELAAFAGIRAKHGRPEVSWEELRAELVRDQRVLLVITPAKAPSEWTAIGV